MRTISFDSLNGQDTLNDVFGVQINYDIIHTNASNSTNKSATKQGSSSGKGYSANKSQKYGSPSSASSFDDASVDVGSRSNTGFDGSPSDYEHLFSSPNKNQSSTTQSNQSTAIQTATTLKELTSIYKNCERCKETLSRIRRDKVTIVPRETNVGKKVKVMIVAEMFDSNSYNDFLANNTAIENGVINGGCTYYGKTYEMLERMLTSEKTLGVSMDEVYITSIVKCCFSDNETTPEDISNCKDYLLSEIKLVNPEAIITFSSKAVQALFYGQKNLDDRMDKLIEFELTTDISTKKQTIKILTACFKSLSYIGGLKDDIGMSYKKRITSVLLEIKNKWQKN